MPRTVLGIFYKKIARFRVGSERVWERGLVEDSRNLSNPYPFI